MQILVRDRWSSNNKAVLAVLLLGGGILCGYLGTLLADRFPLEISATVLFSLAVMGCVLLFPRLGIALLMFYALASPPFVDYELAWKAVTAYRAAGTAGIRLDITQPILCLIDILLILVFVQSLADPRQLSKSFTKVDLSVLVSFFLLIFGCLLALLLVLSEGSSLKILAGFAGSMNYVRMGLAIVVATVKLRDERQILRALLLLAIGGWFFLAQSLYISIYKAGGFDRLLAYQLTGLIPGPGATASLLLLLAMPLLALSISTPQKEDKQGHRYFFGFTAIAMLLYTLLTFVRSALFGTIAALALFSILIIRVKQRTMVTMALLGLLLFAGVFAVIPDFYQMKYTSMLSGDLSSSANLDARLSYWNTALQSIKRHWLLGKGAASWGLIEHGSTSTHNSYLQIAFEMGIPFLLVWGLMVAIVLWRGLVRAMKLSKKRLFTKNFVLIAGFLSGLIGFLMTQMFTTTIFHHRIIIIFGIWLVMVNKLGRVKDPSLLHSAY